MSESWVAKDEHTRAKFLEFAQDYMKDHRFVVWTWQGDTRTGAQNSALHVYLRQLSETLNDAGISVNKFFKDGYEVPFNDKTVKLEIWHKMQEAVTGKESSTKLSPKEMGEVYDRVNLALARHGVHVPWPSKDSK